MEIKQLIAEAIKEAVDKAYPGVDTGLDYEALLEVPPDSKMGDFAFPCFRLSKSLRMGPPMIAAKLGEELCDEIIAEAGIAKGTYYYYFPSKEATLEAVIDMMIDEEAGN